MSPFFPPDGLHLNRSLGGIDRAGAGDVVTTPVSATEAAYGIRHAAGEAIGLHDADIAGQIDFGYGDPRNETDDLLEIDWKASASRYQRGVRLLSSDGSLNW